MTNQLEFLEKIIEYKEKDIPTIKTYIENHSSNLIPTENKHPHKFKNAISEPQSLSLIAEVKKASPSKGLIYDNFNPLEIAQNFQKKGASALSVLTEEHYFLGHPTYIKEIKKTVNLPILRKDFIIHTDQIIESKLIGADAILLIKAILTNKNQIQEFLTVANEHHLDVIMEIHDESEIEEIKDLEHLSIIGINNRNLKTFQTDTQQSLNLYSKIKTYFPDATIIAESGYNSTKDLTELNTNNFDAVLIGEGLKTNPELLNFFHH